MQATATFFLLHAIDALEAALLALLYNQSSGVSAIDFSQYKSYKLSCTFIKNNLKTLEEILLSKA